MSYELSQNMNGMNIINNYTKNNNYNDNNNYIINNNANGITNQFGQCTINPLFNSNQNQNEFYTEKKINFNNNTNDDIYQKMKEDKINEIIKSQKNKRFMHIYLKKINKENNINIQLKNNNNNINEDIFIDEYINKVKENYQDLNNYYNFVEQNGEFNFSQCPFCDNPVIYKLERVLCINKCFITAVPEETFDKNYTLSNFMEQYKEYYSKHLKCKSDLMTLYVDKESKCAEFLCYKCEKNYIDFN